MEAQQQPSAMSQHLGANIDAINKAENREQFKHEMDQGGIETAKGGFAKTMDDALDIIDDIPYRPVAGVKDISIEYKGGGMRLGATRTAEISWTCWTYDDLDRLTPHILHTGNTVFIDWGWSGVGDINPTNVELFPILVKKDTGLVKICGIDIDKNAKKCPCGSMYMFEAWQYKMVSLDVL